MEIVSDIYSMTISFPIEEKYALITQLRKCAVSMPSNIAEGFARRHNKEYKQFLYIALGSSAELETQLDISNKLNYLDERTYLVIMEKINHFSRMTVNLIKCL